MGSSIGRQEIISTPEAKGMRTLASSRGMTINVSTLIVRRGVGVKTLRTVPIGRADNPEQYVSRKAAAASSFEATQTLWHLQVDTPKSAAAPTHQLLHSTAGFAGLDDTELAPPNSQIAAGPEHLIVTVNSAWAVFDKAGRQLLRRDLEDTFASLIDNAIIFNPKVLYDPFRNGWVIGACARGVEGQRMSFLLAFSHGSDPLGDWWIWALDARFDGANRTGLWADGLGLAVDNTSLYLTANMFTAQGQFLYAKLRILSRKELQTGGVLHGWDFWQLRNFDGSPAFGLQPAINMCSAGGQYLLNATPDGQGLTQWTLSQPPRQTPILSRRYIPTAPYQFAPNAKQQTTDREIETGDPRLCNVVFRHGQLWTAHTISANWGGAENVAAIQWFQINPRAGRITQQGILGAPDFHYFCPAVMVDGEGNLILAFNRSAESELPVIRFTGRCASDNPNTLQESILLQQSSAPGAKEWGICSSIANAPHDSTIWLIGQYAATGSDWATWIGAVTYSRQDDAAKRPIIKQSVLAS